MEKLRSSDKSDKSMDLLKSVKSEDLSKDLQVNPRISPQTVKDFLMNWMNKSKQTDIDPNQTDIRICIQMLFSVLRDPALRNKHITQFWEESDTKHWLSDKAKRIYNIHHEIHKNTKEIRGFLRISIQILKI